MDPGASPPSDHVRGAPPEVISPVLTEFFLGS
jgi:hypothetical protein